MTRLALSASRNPSGARGPAAPRALFLALFAGALLAACGGDSAPTEPPLPVSVTVTPTSAIVNAGATTQFTASVANTTNTALTWTASGGQIAPSGASATWTAPGTGGTYTITATSAADATRSASATVTVNAVGVAVSPTTITIGAGDTLPLTATVTNAVNESVTWTASSGTIVGTGASVRWAAPVTGGSYTVTATSVLDPTRTGTATVTVTPVTVAVTAASAALFRGEGTTLTAAVAGTSDLSVTWTASCGTITGTGASVQYTAPATAGTCTVQATSVRDPATRGERALTVRRAWRVAAFDDTNDGACTFQHCSFREAVVAANADPDRDSIIVVGGATPTTITLANALPVLSTAVDVVGPGAATLTIDAAATVASPRGVLYVAGEFQASVRGLTLRGGRRAGGGGLVVDNKANLMLRDVAVRNNTSVDAAGGGVLVLREARATFVDVEITGNRSSGANSPGGGLSVEAGTLVTMVRGRIADNEAVNAFAGGVRVFNSALVLDSTVLEENRALTTTVGLALGGGLFADGPEATVQLIGATVRANRAAEAGGGLALRGGTTATITGTIVRGNEAPVGAGIETGNSPVTLVNTEIAENRATSRGGGVFVFNDGRYTHTGGSIRDNTATSQGGGGLYAQQQAQVTLTDVAVNDNDGGATSGGGVWAGNTVQLVMRGGSLTRNRAGTVGGGLFLNSSEAFTLERVQVDANRAATGGGGVFLGGTNSGRIMAGRFADNETTGGAGGGIFVQNGTLVVDSTVFLRNLAPASGGGALLAATAGTYTLRDVIAEENRSNAGGAFGFQGAMTVTIEGGRLRANRSGTVGGAVWKAGQVSLTMTGTEVLDNLAGTQGGGIQLVGPGAPATLRRLTVRGNTATTASGGGVTAGVTTLIEQSSFAGNSTGAIGGGLFAASTGNVTVRNSTFSGNTAAVGGGIAATGPGTITNVTLVANTATDYGAGLGTNNAGALTVTNVLLSGNRVGDNAANCGRGGTSTITSSGGNLSADTTCTTFTQPTDKPNTAAGVNTALADNGGTTFTHALLEGSAAINAGVAAACPVTDQRGFSRVGVCDIGAFEFGGQATAGASWVGPRRNAVRVDATPIMGAVRRP